MKQYIKRYIHRMTNYARTGSCPHKHAAFVMVGKKIVGKAINTPCNGVCPSRHAEQMALKNARENLSKKGKKLRRHIVIVIRSNMMNSHPCIECANNLNINLTNRVYYSFENDIQIMNPRIVKQIHYSSYQRNVIRRQI
jgi:tRNA(Arg) A34 adenosine deaminase TadA